MGAWIEIVDFYNKSKFKVSLLSWERGLKFIVGSSTTLDVYVAPLVGAWIEISLSKLNKHSLHGRSSRGSVD